MKIDHQQHVSLLIRNQINMSEGKFDEDDYLFQLEDPDMDIGTNSFCNIVLGAKQKPLSFAKIEALYSGSDAAFEHFQAKFCSFLSILLPTEPGVYEATFTQAAMVGQNILTIWIMD
jgi:hypothetical protein